VRTEDVFAQHLAERKSSVSTEMLSDILIAGHRLWYSADVMSMQAPENTPCPCSEFVGALQHCTTRLSDGYGEVSRALRSGEPVRGVDSRIAMTHHLGPQATSCARAMEGSSQPAELTSGVHLFELRSWLLELSDDLQRLEQLVLSLRPAPQSRDAGKQGRQQLPMRSEPTRI
jgi:hypothetical protein